MQAVYNRSLSRSLSLAGEKKKVFTDDSHSNNLLKGLCELRQSNTFCDISLQVNEHQIQAHKLVLSAFCPYFAAMFRHHTKEQSQEVVNLPDFLSAITIEMLVDFAYTAQLTITGDVVQDLLVAANFLSIDSVQMACCAFLSENLDASNCVNVMIFADLLGCTDLVARARNFISFHFTDVIQADEFLELPSENVASLLQMDDVCIEHPVGVVGTSDVQEQVIYDSVIKYINYAPEARRHLLADWLNYVRLPLLSETAFRKVEEDLLQKGGDTDRSCSELVQKAKEQKVQMGAGAGLEDTWCQPRRYKTTNFGISKGFANHGYVVPDLESFEDKCEDKGIQCHVNGMKLWIRRWDGRPVLGGLSVYFSNGSVCTHGQTDCPDVHEFHLDPDERIIEISVNCGYLIDQLTFHTTKNRTFGPYGGPGGGERSTRPHSDGKFGHLIGLSGSLVQTQESFAITRLKFLWMSYMSMITLAQKESIEADKLHHLHHRWTTDPEDSAEYSSEEEYHEIYADSDSE